MRKKRHQCNSPWGLLRVLLLSEFMFLRIYLIFILMKMYSKVYRKRFDMFGVRGNAKGKYDVHLGTSMVLRVLLYRKIIFFFLGLAGVVLILGTFMIMIAEKHEQPELGNRWIDAFWFTAFNYLTVGEENFPVTDLV